MPNEKQQQRQLTALSLTLQYEFDDQRRCAGTSCSRLSSGVADGFGRLVAQGCRVLLDTTQKPQLSEWMDMKLVMG